MNNIFTSRIRAAVVILGALSLIAMLTSFVFGRALYKPPPKPNDAVTLGPIGHGAAFLLLEKSGIRVERWRQFNLIDVELPLVIVEPEYEEFDSPASFVSLKEVIRERAKKNRVTVLVLPKWSLGEFGFAEISSHARDILDAASLNLKLLRSRAVSDKRELVKTTGTFGEFSIEIPSPQRVTGGEKILGDEKGSFVVSNSAHTTYVFADPDVLHNFNFDKSDNARVLTQFFKKELATDAIALDEVFHGSVVHKSITEIFSTWPGMLVFFHVILIVLLVSWHVLRRDAPLQTRFRERHGPQHAIAVSASVLASGSRESVLVHAYVERMIRYLSQQMLHFSSQTVEEQARALDGAMTTTEVKKISELLQESRTAGATVVTASQMHKIVERSLNLKKEPR